jgi:hypothetical protein
LHTGLQRTFVSRDCPFFKVDVQFQAVGRSNRDGKGCVTLIEDGRDIILRISRPNLQFTVVDQLKDEFDVASLCPYRTERMGLLGVIEPGSCENQTGVVAKSLERETRKLRT